jgi:hypothetical protein
MNAQMKPDCKCAAWMILCLLGAICLYLGAAYGLYWLAGCLMAY